jgi:hypothetical protein
MPFVKKENEKKRENLMKKGEKGINRDITAFAFFLILSFILWYLNSLGKEIEAEIKFPLEFTNIPNEREIVDELPADLNLFLKGPGYSILKLKIFGKKTPLVIDMSKVNYKRAQGDLTLDYYIVTSGLTKSLNIQMRSGCEITSIKPDTLFFTYIKIVPSSSVITDKTDNRKKR